MFTAEFVQSFRGTCRLRSQSGDRGDASVQAEHLPVNMIHLRDSKHGNSGVVILL